MIQINTTIFPKVMGIALGKPHDENEITENTDASDVDISIDLPRGANLLYLEKVISEENEVEKKLLTQYAYGQHFSDEDYESLLKMENKIEIDEDLRLKAYNSLKNMHKLGG